MPNFIVYSQCLWEKDKNGLTWGTLLSVKSYWWTG